MPLHPEIAKALATLPAPPDGPLDPAAMRAAEEEHLPPAEARLPLHSVEDTTARTPSGGTFAPMPRRWSSFKAPRPTLRLPGT